MVPHRNGSRFRIPLQINFSDEIDSIQVIIGFKRDDTVHCGTRGTQALLLGTSDHSALRAS